MPQIVKVDGREPGSFDGPLGHLGTGQTGGQIGNAYFTYGSAPGRQTISIDFDGHRYQVPVSRHGVWAFTKPHTDAAAVSLPPLGDPDMGMP